MKSLFVTIILISTSLHAYNDKRDVYEEQSRTIESILDKHLPAPVLPENDWDPKYWEGRTSDGSACSIIRTRGVMFKDHPELQEYEEKKDYSFRWEKEELSMDVVGLPIMPKFVVTNNSLDANVKLPRGYFSSFRFELKLKFNQHQISVKIRNNRTLIPSYKECIFRK